MFGLFRDKRKRYFSTRKHIRNIAVFLIVAVGIVCFSRYMYIRGKQRKKWTELEHVCIEKAEAFPGTPAIFIKDLKTGWSIRHNEELDVPSASIVKVPIMVSCFLASDEGIIDLDKKITLKSRDKVGGSGLLKNEPGGKKFAVKTLMKLSVTKSDNTASNMLIDLLGLDYLNESFKELGLNNTNISRKMMHMKKRDRGIENYTTATDMALILEELYRGRIGSGDISSKCLELLKQQTINTRIPRNLPADIPVAHKTGLEKGVCHDAGIVYTPTGDFIICILIKHKDKSSRRSKNFIADIAYVVYKNYYE